MSRTLSTVCVAIVLTAGVALAQANVAGKWTGQEQRGPSSVPVLLQLAVKASDVTGSVTVGESPATAISDGKVSENKLTFKTTASVNGNNVSVLWEGELKQDQLTLVRLFGGENGRKLPPLTLERAK
jgi:hypothetical protein